MDKGEGVKKSKNFTDIISGSSQRQSEARDGDDDALPPLSGEGDREGQRTGWVTITFYAFLKKKSFLFYSSLCLPNPSNQPNSVGEVGWHVRHSKKRNQTKRFYNTLLFQFVRKLHFMPWIVKRFLTLSSELFYPIRWNNPCISRDNPRADASSFFLGNRFDDCRPR